MKKQRHRKAITQGDSAGSCRAGTNCRRCDPRAWHVITSSFCIQSVSVPFEGAARVSSGGRRGRLDTALWGRRNSCRHSLHVRTASQARLALMEAGVIVKEQGPWDPAWHRDTWSNLIPGLWRLQPSCSMWWFTGPGRGGGGGGREGGAARRPGSRRGRGHHDPRLSGAP